MPRKFKTKGDRWFIYHVVGFADKLTMTEEQVRLLREFIASERPHEYLPVWPPTIVVHQSEASEQIKIEHCVFITDCGRRNLLVFAAPRFCCRQPAASRVFRPLLNGYGNRDRRQLDVDVVETTNSPPSFSGRVDDISQCQKKYGFGFDAYMSTHSQFALACGHSACRPCWLTHAQRSLRVQLSPIPCIRAGCEQRLAMSGAAALVNAASLGVMREFEWRRRLAQREIVRCAGCSRWLQKRADVEGRLVACGCADCGCFTCTRCAHVEHSPLPCADAARWRAIRKDERAAARAADELSLDDAAFKQCLRPRSAITTKQWTENIAGIRSYSKKRGRAFERDMHMAAVLLEMRLVQQLAGLQYRKTERNSEWDSNEAWMGLGRVFCDCLALKCYNDIKIEALRKYCGEVINC